MATQIDIVDLLTVLRAGLPKQKIESHQFDEMVPVWTTILEDIPKDTLQMAAREWCSRDDPFFPSVGQIRQIALDLTATDQDMITAGDAWSEAKRAIGNRSHEWSSPIVRKAFEAIGGHTYFRYALMSAEMSDRARFMDAFETYRKRADVDRRMLPDTRAFVAQHRQIEYQEGPERAEQVIKRLTNKMEG